MRGKHPFTPKDTPATGFLEIRRPLKIAQAQKAGRA
jgi:hypothetical protein